MKYVCKMGYIYCLTSPSGKRYIGQTRRDIQKRLREHSKLLRGCVALNSAIQKYGFEKFQVEILLVVNDELLDEYEIKMIDSYQSLFPNGYNIRTGGSVNSRHCEESCERMRQSKMGSKNPNFGKPRSEKNKLAISQSKSGINHHFYGKSFSVEHKLKLSASHKSNTLPMYLLEIKARPEHYTGDGYAIVNHPTLPNKYFTSKKLSKEEKYLLASKYLESGNTDAVQRLNGDGSCENKA